MKLKIKRYALQALLDRVTPASFCRLEAQQSTLSAIATEIGVERVARTRMVDIEEGGFVSLSPRILEVLEKAAGDEVSIDATEDKATLKSGSSVWHLSVPFLMSREETALGKLDEPHLISTEKLLRALQAVCYDVKEAFSRSPCPSISLNNGKVTAFDNARISQIILEESRPLSVSIPISLLPELLLTLREATTETVGVNPLLRHTMFSFPNYTLSLATPFVPFPAQEVEKMILRAALTNDQPLTVDRMKLIAAVRRMPPEEGNVSSGKVSLIVTPPSESFKPGLLRVTAVGKLGDRTTETLDAEWHGAAQALVVNGSYLLEVLESHSEESCQFFLGKDGKSRKCPLLLKGTDGSMSILYQMSGAL